eukprot:scaffold35756_cov20-Tisochrysis_lutea.AAC.3
MSVLPPLQVLRGSWSLSKKQRKWLLLCGELRGQWSASGSVHSFPLAWRCCSLSTSNRRAISLPPSSRSPTSNGAWL